MLDTIKNEVVKATSEYVVMGNNVLKTRYPRTCGSVCTGCGKSARIFIVSPRCCSRSTYVLNDVQKCTADNAQFVKIMILQESAFRSSFILQSTVK